MCQTKRRDTKPQVTAASAGTSLRHPLSLGVMCAVLMSHMVSIYPPAQTRGAEGDIPPFRKKTFQLSRGQIFMTAAGLYHYSVV